MINLRKKVVPELRAERPWVRQHELFKSFNCAKDA